MQPKIDLTRNEKKVLKLLIADGRKPDADIARTLNITSQAVGKIRKKLETEEIIEGYSTRVDYAKLGIKVFAVVLFKYIPDVWKKIKSDEDVNQRVKGPHIINFYRVPEGDVTHIVTYGFRSLDELDHYFHTLQTERGHLSEIRKLYVFSAKSLIKENPKELLLKVIDEIDQEKLARPLKPEI